MAKNLPKIASTMEVFVLSERSRDIPQVLNPSILIVWIQFSIVSL